MKYMILLGLLLLAGCAVGRGPAGEIVIGVEAGVLVDTAEQAMIGTVGQIPVVGGLLQQILIGATAGGLTIGGTSKLLLNKLESRRKKADIARELAERELAIAKAKLENGGS
jgi:hypothetical protein